MDDVDDAVDVSSRMHVGEMCALPAGMPSLSARLYFAAISRLASALAESSVSPNAYIRLPPKVRVRRVRLRAVG